MHPIYTLMTAWVKFSDFTFLISSANRGGKMIFVPPPVTIWKGLDS